MTGTERKVFQKYYPPDFDPSKIPRAKGQRNRQFVQRVMAPYNMQCNTCHEYIYKGKKFNMRRETAEGETYLGLKIFRFYFRCPNCLAEITFKTDLENCDYQQEHGATRLFEAFKLYQQEEKAKETKEEEEKKDPMKMLEKRTKTSRAEMEALGKLEELQETNRRHETYGPDQYLRRLAEEQAEALREQEEKDEQFIRKLYGRTEDGKIIKRILDDDEDINVEVKVKSEIKCEPSESQEPSCSSLNTENWTPNVSKQGSTYIASKRPSQKEILSRVIAKKQHIQRAEQAVVKIEVAEVANSSVCMKVTTVEEEGKPKMIVEKPHATVSISSALQDLNNYSSGSSSE
ncbi:unnamed protein product [Thelazia callipaeda]|uniref:Splicing factor YJU2 n=1 Tax=Thelazia callipaeda TaxID=103827 RepID=A0A0N5D5M1_THECL|nr:unnamed protein product [Thelazia callipaeda]